VTDEQPLGDEGIRTVARELRRGPLQGILDTMSNRSKTSGRRAALIAVLISLFAPLGLSGAEVAVIPAPSELEMIVVIACSPWALLIHTNGEAWLQASGNPGARAYCPTNTFDFSTVYKKLSSNAQTNAGPFDPDIVLFVKPEEHYPSKYYIEWGVNYDARLFDDAKKHCTPVDAGKFEKLWKEHPACPTGMNQSSGFKPMPRLPVWKK
jgi:hypothetical protein